MHDQMSSLLQTVLANRNQELQVIVDQAASHFTAQLLQVRVHQAASRPTASRE